MTTLSPFALSPSYITGRRYNKMLELSEIDVYQRIGEYAVKLFWKKCNERDVELILDLTGNLDAPL